MEKNQFQESLKVVESFLLNSTAEINYVGFFISIFFSALLAYLVKLTFIKVSRTLNDRDYFSDIFVPLAVITALVITVIKFSLALSLGLVGALSIVRFRAAIKEPEELVYLFFVIAIGLANGANQYIISTIATFFIIFILFIRKFFQDKNENFSSTTSSTANVLQIEILEKNLDVDLLIKEIAENTKFLKLKSFKIDSQISQYIFWFDLEKSNFGKFIAFTQKLSEANKNISIDVYSRSGIYE
tara:strand:- start:2243 stop:2971 length:729 start_codon:yes stop_codon:yes gene_type:complete